MTAEMKGGQDNGGGTFVGSRMDLITGVFLVDAEGKRYGKGVRMLRPTGEVMLVFGGVPEVPGDWSLVWSYPTKVLKRTYPFAINVPAERWSPAAKEEPAGP